MGRGLVEPVDDFRDTNPATHPELLDYLADTFRQHNYRLRPLLKTIAMSDAYGRSGSRQSNRSDNGEFLNTEPFYAHALRRPLPPEVLADAISDVLEAPAKYDAEEARAVSLVDPTIPSRSLEALGRCDRTDSCETEMSGTMGMPKQLHLLNGPLLNARIGAPTGRLQRLRREQKPPIEIVTRFYLAALAREPNQRERAHWVSQLANLDSTQHEAFLEDFVWALLCSEEFGANH